MRRTTCHPRGSWRGLALLLLLVALPGAGCNRTQSADHALAKAYETTGGKKEEVAKLAGTVTVDGQPPGDTGPSRIVVMLYDPKKPDGLKKAPIYTVCDEEGRFAFSTYGNGDGVPPGAYVVLFAQLRMNLRGGMGYGPPDALKNEYNDPDKNEKVAEFKIEVVPPGKSDHQFDLKKPASDTAATPGPRAVTMIK